MSKSMTATEARKNFFEVIETATKPGMTVTITHEGHPKVVVMSLDEYEGWQETLDILSDPTLVREIKIGIADREIISLDELERKEHAGKQNVPSAAKKIGTKAVRKAARKRA